MKTIKQLLTTIAVLLCSVVVNAHDFVVDGIYYNITSTENLTVAVTCRGEYYGSYLSEQTCPECDGKRLSPMILSVLINGKNIFDFTNLSVHDALDFIKNLELTETEQQISRIILKEIKSRLEFLDNVGLNYLSLSRRAGTLSGGESQRIRLATQIGSHLTDVLYVLDEPSIGLHQRDNDMLISTLLKLRCFQDSLILKE